jgi:hypothetical protein
VQQTVAQFMGVLVTVVVVFGTDLDVLFAVPLGIFAGVLTFTLASLPRTLPQAVRAIPNTLPRVRALLRRKPR